MLFCVRQGFRAHENHIRHSSCIYGSDVFLGAARVIVLNIQKCGVILVSLQLPWRFCSRFIAAQYYLGESETSFMKVMLCALSFIIAGALLNISGVSAAQLSDLEL